MYLDPGYGGTLVGLSFHEAHLAQALLASLATHGFSPSYVPLKSASHESIPATLAVFLFALGVTFCYLYTSVYFFLGIVSDEPVVEECQVVMLVGKISIWASTLPMIPFFLATHYWAQIGYLAVFTVIALGILPRGVRRNELDRSSSLAVFSIMILTLTLTIYAFTEPASLPPLAAAFTTLLITNNLGLVIFLLQPFEVLGIARHWSASFHAMYLIATFGVITYSQEVMRTAVAQSA